MATGLTAAVSQRHAGDPPAEFADLLPYRPILSSVGHGWKSVMLQRFQMAPTLIATPAVPDHKLVLHLGGPTLIEEERGRRERRWADSGHAMLVPAGVPIARSIKSQTDALLVHIASALVDEVVAEAYGLDPACVCLVERLAMPDESLDRLGRLLLAEAEAQAPGGRLVADMLARALAVHLLRRHSSLAPRLPDMPGKEAMPDRRMRRVIEHMHAHLAEDLSLAQLAAVGGLGASRFAQAFRASTGEPPHRFLVRLRIERARELLERTALPVVEVGLRCGFEQPNHFATMFRKLTGMSPRAYRTARCT